MTLSQVGLTALGALAGAVIGGRLGSAAGSVAGMAAGVAAVPDYKPLAQCYNELSDEQKADLKRRIQNKVGSPGIAMLQEFMRNPENLMWVKNSIRSARQ